MARNADMTNNAKENNICINDKVLVKQNILNKYTTPFNPNPYNVIGINGLITAEKDNQHITWNVSYFMKV